jgi:hypothetical protein
VFITHVSLPVAGKRLLPNQYSATAQFFSQAMGNFKSTIGNESWREELTGCGCICASLCADISQVVNISRFRSVLVGKAICAATKDALGTFTAYCDS